MDLSTDLQPRNARAARGCLAASTRVGAPWGDVIVSIDPAQRTEGISNGPRLAVAILRRPGRKVRGVGDEKEEQEEK